MTAVSTAEKEEIQQIVQELEKLKIVWKAQLVIFWDYDDKILKPMDSKTKIIANLPAFDNPKMETTAGELQKIYRAQDDYLGYSHLTHIMALFETLTKTANKSKLNWNDFLTGIGIEVPDIAELTLARETRNCHIHAQSKADDKWIAAYSAAKNNTCPINRGVDIKKAFPGTTHTKLLQQIYDWHELIIKSSNKINQTVATAP